MFSAVVLTLNEGPRLRETVLMLAGTLPAGSELLVVDDGSTDGSTDFLKAASAPARLVCCHHLGTARARNWGARQTRGDTLVFADAHIALPAGWWQPLAELLAVPAVGAAAPAVADTTEPECKGYGYRLAGPDLTIEWLPRVQDTPHPVALLPACCLAIRRDIFDAVGGFDEGLVRWGGMETELGLRLWSFGYQLWLAPDVECSHFFREERPYRVEWSWVLHNRLRLAMVHFDRRRIERVIEALRDHEGFAEATGMLADSDISNRRAEVSARRCRDAEWFFERFGPAW